MAYDRLFHREMLARAPLDLVEILGPNATLSAPTASPRTTQGQAAPTIQTPHSWDGFRALRYPRKAPNLSGSRSVPPNRSPEERRISAGTSMETGAGLPGVGYLHICSGCSGPHAAIHCPQHQTTPANRGGPARSRTSNQAWSSRSQPYPSGPTQGSEQQ